MTLAKAASDVIAKYSLKYVEPMEKTPYSMEFTILKKQDLKL